MLNGISALCPDSDNVLQSEVLKPFAVQMKADLSSLFNEIQVLKSMLKDTKLKSIVDLYVELLPLKQAFPTTIFFIIAAMTIPVSSTQSNVILEKTHVNAQYNIMYTHASL